MKPFRLASGRKVGLLRFAVVPTYQGCLEGSLDSNSRHIFKRIPEKAARILPPAWPLVVISPSEMPLPSWFCVAELESPKGVHHDDADFHSKLYACWFVEDLENSIGGLIADVLPAINWDQFAEDVDTTYI